MKISVKPKLIKWITFGEKIAAIAIFPFILLAHQKYRENKILINHEKIHLRQQIELGILLFYLWYGLEYIFRLIQFKNKNLAYLNISFEREAYENELNMDYLPTRKFFSFLNYLRIK
jgi:hypothetical protein